MSYQQTNRTLTSQADAANIENARVPRSTFKNQWSRKTSFDAGYIIPILVDEILPGDHVRYDITAYLRMSTPLFPIFDSQRVDTHFFFVPNRLVWDNWVKFMGEQENPDDSIAFLIPTIAYSTAGVWGSIYDHFGLPLGISLENPINVNALPFRAFNLIWNTWFRDQNLQTRLTVVKADSGDDQTMYALQRRAKSHDYFTSCLPWPQKFDAPTVPLGGLAPVLGIGYGAANTPSANSPALYETGATGTTNYTAYYASNAAGAYFQAEDASLGSQPTIYADLQAASGVAINTLRQAWLVQQLLERDARGGTRYVELIRSHFGVTNPDFRLQRPEYIGGGSSNLNITPIAQTAPSEGVPLGALGAAGTASGSHRASYAATEHGHIIGLLSIKSELSYQQGLHKLWTRQSRYDYYWPSLAGLGEQAVLTKEIVCIGNPGSDNTVFGYQERWQEYRTRYSDVTGGMRSLALQDLDRWHLAQVFGPAAPSLNSTFIKDDPPMDRVLAAAETALYQQYLADILYHRTITRALPTFGTPVTLGRF